MGWLQKWLLLSKLEFKSIAEINTNDIVVSEKCLDLKVVTFKLLGSKRNVDQST